MNSIEKKFNIAYEFVRLNLYWQVFHQKQNLSYYDFQKYNNTSVQLIKGFGYWSQQTC